MPIGIDLGTAVVRMVQMRSVNDDLELAGAACVGVPDDCRGDPGKRREFLGGVLHGLLKSGGFKGRRCALSLSAGDAFIHHVKTANVPEEELGRALRPDIEGELPFDYDDAVIRYLVAGRIRSERGPGQEVVVLAVSRRAVEGYLDLAHGSRLDVAALCVEPCAILECFSRFSRRADDESAAALFLDLGQSHAHVVIAHGPKLVFARSLAHDADRIERQAGAALGVSVERVRYLRRELLDSTAGQSAEADRLYDAIGESLNAIVGEITKCLRYYDSVFPSKPVERAVFLGGEAQDRRLCRGIAKRLNLPSQIGDPLARVRQSGRDAGPAGLDLRRTQPAWAVAVGLSLGAQEHRLAEVNQ